MKLGVRADIRKRRTAVRVVRPAVAVRPAAVEGFDVVWYPHRDALSLLPANMPPRRDSTQTSVVLSRATPPWSWLG